MWLKKRLKLNDPPQEVLTPQYKAYLETSSDIKHFLVQRQGVDEENVGE